MTEPQNPERQNCRCSDSLPFCCSEPANSAEGMRRRRRWCQIAEDQNCRTADPPRSSVVVLGRVAARTAFLPSRCHLSSESRKEVIQPQVPLRLPCYDFTPVADLTVVGCLPCGLAHRLKVKPTPMV